MGLCHLNDGLNPITYVLKHRKCCPERDPANHDEYGSHGIPLVNVLPSSFPRLGTGTNHTIDGGFRGQVG